MPIRSSILAAVVALGVLAATAQSPVALGAQGAAQAPQPGMPEMMKMHEQMMAEMQAANATLDALVRTMNSTTGAGKIDAVAAVVNELARQHAAMTTRMSTMHKQMMGAMGPMKH